MMKVESSHLRLCSISFFRGSVPQEEWLVRGQRTRSGRGARFPALLQASHRASRSCRERTPSLRSGAPRAGPRAGFAAATWPEETRERILAATQCRAYAPHRRRLQYRSTCSIPYISAHLSLLPVKSKLSL